jgi:hypothetical protein
MINWETIVPPEKYGESWITTERRRHGAFIIYRDIIQERTTIGGIGKVTDIKYVVINEEVRK